MKKQLLTSLFVAASIFGLKAQYNVSIYANLSNETVSPNGVHITGSFQSELGGTDWDPSSSIMYEESPGVFSFLAYLPNGVYEYKIVNGNDLASGENSIPAICQGDNGNRFFVVDGSDILLPPVYFNGLIATENGTDLYTPVRFSIEMGIAIIDPSGVSARGTWQEVANAGLNWQPGGNKLYDVLPNDGLNIYTGIFYVPATPSTYVYKFLNGAIFEGVPTECANAIGNRELTINATAGTSVLYCFGTCNSECVIIPNGIEESKPMVDLLYPNPADNSTTIQFNNSSINQTITLSNLLGKQILKASNVRGSYVIERGNLASGVYFVQITDSKGQTRTQKLTFR
jgi:hypothetical protein